jgi:hypothetical protein
VLPVKSTRDPSGASYVKSSEKPEPCSIVMSYSPASSNRYLRLMLTDARAVMSALGDLHLLCIIRILKFTY